MYCGIGTTVKVKCNNTAKTTRGELEVTVSFLYSSEMIDHFKKNYDKLKAHNRNLKAPIKITMLQPTTQQRLQNGIKKCNEVKGRKMKKKKETKKMGHTAKTTDHKLLSYTNNCVRWKWSQQLS